MASAGFATDTTRDDTTTAQRKITAEQKRNKHGRDQTVSTRKGETKERNRRVTRSATLAESKSNRHVDDNQLIGSTDGCDDDVGDDVTASDDVTTTVTGDSTEPKVKKATSNILQTQEY